MAGTVPERTGATESGADAEGAAIDRRERGPDHPLSDQPPPLSPSELEAAVARRAILRRQRGTEAFRSELRDDPLLRAVGRVVMDPGPPRAPLHPDDATIQAHLGGFARGAMEALAPPEGLPADNSPRTFASALTPPPIALRTTRTARRRDRPAPVPRPFAEEWRATYGLRPPAIPPLDVKAWEAAYPRMAAAGPISLQAALRIGGAISLGELRAAGWNDARRLGDDTPVNKIVSAVVYVGAGFAAVFTPAGELLETANGHLMPVVAVSASESFREQGMPGIFLGGKDVYAIVSGTGSKEEDIRVRKGFFGLTVSGKHADRQELRRELGGGTSIVMFVVSPSYWNRRSVAQAVAGAVGRVTDVVAVAIVRGYLRNALGSELQEVSAGELAKDAVLAVLQKIAPILDPGVIEDTRRIAMATGMAIWPGEGMDVAPDLEVAARVLAPELASQLIGAAAGGARKDAGRAAGGIVRGGAKIRSLVQQRGLTSDSRYGPEPSTAQGSTKRPDPSRPRPLRPQRSDLSANERRGIAASSVKQGVEPRDRGTSTSGRTAPSTGLRLSPADVSRLRALHPALPRYMELHPKVRLTPENEKALALLFRRTGGQGVSDVARRSSSGELAVLEKLHNERATRSIDIISPSNVKGDRRPDFRVESVHGTYFVESTTPTLARRGAAAQRGVRRLGSEPISRPASSDEIRDAFLRKIKRGQITQGRPGIIVVHLQRAPTDGPVLTTSQMATIEGELASRSEVLELLIVVPGPRMRHILRVGSRDSGLHLAEGVLGSSP